jgi:ankyrin repeat protein
MKANNQNKLAIMKRQLELIISANKEVPSLDGVTLIEAVIKGNVKNVELLIQRGDDINSRASLIDHTALAEAAHHGHIKIVELLIKNGADINKYSGYGLTPLMRAALKGHTKIVGLLINNGSNIHIKLPYLDATALTLAANNGHTETVKLLIERGANVNAITKYGETALSSAVKGGHFGTTLLLIKAGADLSIKLQELAAELAYYTKSRKYLESSEINNLFKLIKNHIETAQSIPNLKQMAAIHLACLIASDDESNINEVKDTIPKQLMDIVNDQVPNKALKYLTKTQIDSWVTKIEEELRIQAFKALNKKLMDSYNLLLSTPL